MKFIKCLIRKVIPIFGIDFYQRLLACSILESAFPLLSKAAIFETRELLWDFAINLAMQKRTPVSFVEYGVHRGYSIKYFAKKIQQKESVFIGLDSFDGLPESWGALPAGHFSTNSMIPSVDDSRVTFIKGWFQETDSTLSDLISGRSNLIVHYDADLYSSTLFALSKIDNLKAKYFAIFDEFPGHEARALYNYIQAYGAEIKFLGKTLDVNKNPGQVFCEISPNGSSAVA